jgi:predicted acylesterase/phospholipase RssA
LVISGGGSDGAFGAGVLKGWTESGKRPVFNIVTGVSTGALIATFAFLGPTWDHEVERFYTQVKQEQI